MGGCGFPARDLGWVTSFLWVTVSPSLKWGGGVGRMRGSLSKNYGDH